ncbi:MAG: hypothetical protein K0B08_01845 [Bacteroidales bacterium]|nr:hypothetical protein [Bacteroidales bacterium]
MSRIYDIPSPGGAGRPIPDPAGQFASPYLGMGNSPVAAVDPSGLWAVGGRFAEMQMLQQAEQKVRDFQRQLMESFSYEEMMRSLQQELLWNEFIDDPFGWGEANSRQIDIPERLLINSELLNQPTSVPTIEEMQATMNNAIKIMRQFYLLQLENKKPDKLFYPVDFNFNGKIGSPDIFGGRNYRYDITLSLGLQEVSAVFIFTPHENPIANFLTNFIPLGYRRKSVYEVYTGYGVELHNYYSRIRQWTIGLLYFSSFEDYNNFLIYVRYP